MLKKKKKDCLIDLVKKGLVSYNSKNVKKYKTNLTLS